MVMGDGGGRGGGIGDGWCNWCEVNNPSNFLFQEFGGYFINERLIRMLIVTRKNYVSQRDPPPPRTHTHTSLVLYKYMLPRKGNESKTHSTYQVMSTCGHTHSYNGWC